MDDASEADAQRVPARLCSLAEEGDGVQAELLSTRGERGEAGGDSRCSAVA